MIRFALLAAVALIAGQATPTNDPPWTEYYATDWKPADGARTPPRIVDMWRCDRRDMPDPAPCRLDIWRQTLSAYHQAELQPPAGGRSYRLLMIQSNIITATPTLYQLDIDATGAGKLSEVSLLEVHDGKMKDAFHAWSGPMATTDVAAFEHALAATRFDVMPKPDGLVHGCHDGENITLEAVKDGRYKWVSEPCGDEAGLYSVLALLRAAPVQPQPN